ncbi:T-cell activation Rho GTPase activating protein [Entamoeba marina]
MDTVEKANIRLIDETCNFWEKQHKFVKAVHSNINKIMSLMSSHGNYIENLILTPNPGPTHIDISSLTTILNGIRSVGDTFNMLDNQINDMLINTTKTIKTKMDNYKKPIKEAKKFEIEEIVEFQSHKIHEYLKVQTPLFFIDYFRVFTSFYQLGQKYIPDIGSYQQVYNNMAMTAEIIEEPPEKTVIYHQPLITILTCEGRTVDQLPRALEEILKILFHKGSNKETINKLALSISFIKFDQRPPEVIAFVLKAYFRNMVEPVIDDETASCLFQTWAEVEKRFSDTAKISGAQALIQSLPPAHYTLFSQLMKVCYKIHSYNDINNMDANNISICLSPSLIHLQQDNPLSLRLLNSFVAFTISNYPQIFSDNITSLFRRTFAPNVINSSHVTSQPQNQSNIDQISPTDLPILPPRRKTFSNKKETSGHKRYTSSSCPGSPSSSPDHIKAETSAPHKQPFIKTLTPRQQKQTTFVPSVPVPPKRRKTPENVQSSTTTTATTTTTTTTTQSQPFRQYNAPSALKSNPSKPPTQNKDLTRPLPQLPDKKPPVSKQTKPLLKQQPTNQTNKPQQPQRKPIKPAASSNVAALARKYQTMKPGGNY